MEITSLKKAAITVTHVLTLEEKKTHFGFCHFFPFVKPDSTSSTLLVSRAKFSSMAMFLCSAIATMSKEFVVSLFVVVVAALSVSVRPAASPRDN